MPRTLSKRISFQDIVARVKRKPPEQPRHAFSIKIPFQNKIAAHPSRIDFTKSPLMPLLRLCRGLGIFWASHNDLTANIYAFYNLGVILVHIIYAIALLQSLFSSQANFIFSTAMPAYAAKIHFVLTLLSIWLLIRLRILAPRLLAESADLLAGQPEFTAVKGRLLRIFSILSAAISAILPVVVGVFHLASLLPSNDTHGSALKCGTFCIFIETIVTTHVAVCVLSASSLLASLLLSNRVEAHQLVVDLHKCTGGAHVDPLIFRYQSIETCVYGVESLLSASLLFIPALCAVALFFAGRFSFKEYTSLLLIYLALPSLSFVCIVACTLLLLVLAASLNGQLARFRGSSRRIADLQQFAFLPTEMMRLLLFMLRLTDDRLALTAGGICIVNRQNMLMALLIFLVIGISVLSIRDGCLRVA